MQIMLVIICAIPATLLAYNTFDNTFKGCMFSIKACKKMTGFFFKK